VSSAPESSRFQLAWMSAAASASSRAETGMVWWPSRQLFARRVA
jgi:hypothetical protein